MPVKGHLARVPLFYGSKRVLKMWGHDLCLGSLPGPWVLTCCAYMVTDKKLCTKKPEKAVARGTMEDVSIAYGKNGKEVIQPGTRTQR